VKVTRRGFLKLSGAAAVGLTIPGLGIDLSAYKKYVEETTAQIQQAAETTTICPYCSVGCGLIVSTKNGQIINIEGDPDHPINEGALCPKGANLMQITAANQHRLTKVLYRAPYGSEWEEKDWDWAISRIAEKIKAVRDADFIKTNSQGKTVNRVETITFHGSSNVNNEECFMMASMARALGMVYIDHQARV
jgi:formate dehydrogenase major subunit